MQYAPILESRMIEGLDRILDSELESEEEKERIYEWLRDRFMERTMFMIKVWQELAKPEVKAKLIAHDRPYQLRDFLFEMERELKYYDQLQRLEDSKHKEIKKVGKAVNEFKSDLANFHEALSTHELRIRPGETGDFFHPITRESFQELLESVHQSIEVDQDLSEAYRVLLAHTDRDGRHA